MTTPGAELPELVQDSRLDVSFDPSPECPQRIAHPVYSGSNTLQDVWIRKHSLGNGGYGVVWLESNQKTNELRAVKEMRIKADCEADYVRELVAITKFSQSRFSNFFVRSMGWFEATGRLFIAMEYCPHGDLKGFLSKNPQLPEAVVKTITSQILTGLRFMHDSGFAHRDLSPGNVLIMSRPPTGEWHVKIGDFGLSKRVAGDPASTVARGTPGFIPPEIFGRESDRIAENMDRYPGDVWALGEIAFQMLTGGPAFSSNGKFLDYARGQGMFPRQALEAVQASDDAIDFLQLVMAWHPNQRITTQSASRHSWMAPPGPAAGPIVPTGSPSAMLQPDRNAGLTTNTTTPNASGNWSFMLPAGSNTARTSRSHNSLAAPQGSLTPGLRNSTTPNMSGQWAAPVQQQPNKITTQEPRRNVMSPPMNAGHSNRFIQHTLSPQPRSLPPEPFGQPFGYQPATPYSPPRVPRAHPLAGPQPLPPRPIRRESGSRSAVYIQSSGGAGGSAPTLVNVNAERERTRMSTAQSTDRYPAQYQAGNPPNTSHAQFGLPPRPPIHHDDSSDFFTSSDESEISDYFSDDGGMRTRTPPRPRKPTKVVKPRRSVTIEPKRGQITVTTGNRGARRVTTIVKEGQ